jgi:hypothetical protein
MAEVQPGVPWTSESPDDLSEAVGDSNDNQEDIELFNSDDAAYVIELVNQAGVGIGTTRIVNDVDATAAAGDIIDYTCQFGIRTLTVPSSLPEGSEIIVALTKVGSGKYLNISFSGIKFGSASASATSYTLRSGSIRLRRYATWWVALSSYVDAAAVPTTGSDAWLKSNFDLCSFSSSPSGGGGGSTNPYGAVISGTARWPDGTTGAYTSITYSLQHAGAIDSWSIVYGTKLVTQPAVTREKHTGRITTRPALVVTDV